MDDNRPDNQIHRGSFDRPLDIDSGADYVACPLPVGTRIDNFVIGDLICGSFSGYTYSATDSESSGALIVQEYFPEEVSVRDIDRVSVLLRDETVSTEFELGLTNFFRLTHALYKFKGKGRAIVGVEQNDTAYYASSFDHRCTLREVLKSGKRVPGSSIESWLKACLKFLVAPHQANLLHLGIHAESILLDSDGEAIVVGFNSVGPSFHIEPHKPEYPYLPIERIRAEAEIIPASDLYSLAAVLLHCMTGEEPAHAAKRTGAVSTGRADPVEQQLRLLTPNYPPSVIKVMRWMLAPQPKERPQSAMEALKALDSSTGTPIPTVRESRSTSGPVARTTSSRVAGPHKSAPAAGSPRRERRLEPTIDSGPVINPVAATRDEAGIEAGLQPTAGTPITKVPKSGGGNSNPTRIAKADGGASEQALLEVGLRNEPIRTPQDWFADEGQPVSRFSVVGRMLGHPISWAGMIVMALVLAWLWLGSDSQPAPDLANDALIPRINVTQGENDMPERPALARTEPNVVLESASQITAKEDTERFQQLRQLDVLERRLEPFFMEAATHLANDRLANPEEASALGAYRQILELDPGNERATQGIDLIRGKLVERADSALATGDLDAAERGAATVAAIDPANPGVSRIRSEIAQIRLREELAAEAERRRLEEEIRQREAAQLRDDQLDGLRTRAIAGFDEGRLVEPPLDNALFYYREMLKLDPTSAPANAGIEQIAASFVRESRRALASGDLELADRNLTTAAAIDPANGEIPAIREQISMRQRLAEQEQRALAEAQRNQEEAQQAARGQSELSLQSGINAYYRGDYEEAYSFLRPLANSGNARAQFRLAVMLHTGRGVPSNRAQARRWFLSALEPIRVAAEEGRAWAQADLGSYYEDGIILDANYPEAARWYVRAADQGYSGAQTNLGVMYANGQGVSPDMDQAVEWFKRAAVQGDSIAKENLRILGYDPNDIVLGAQN